MSRIAPEVREEEIDCQRIKLEPEQALQVPFPPGCPVLVMDKVLQNRILCSGEVASVFVSFARNTGSCDNSYKVASMNVNGQAIRKIVNGAQVRYAINCPVKVLQSGTSKLKSTKSIDGTIVGFESQPSSIKDIPSLDISAFLYTVDVIVFDNNKKSRLLRQRGISPNYLRFRPLAAETQYLNEEKSSVVSFDEASGREDSVKSSSSGSSDEQGEITIPAEKKIKTEDGSCQLPYQAPTSPTSDVTGRPQYSIGSTTCQSIVTSFASCTPLSPPIPGKFQGDMEKNKNATVPDFISLVNFPTSRQGTFTHADGTKMCVMCGQARFLSSPKMVNKTKGKLANMGRSDPCSPTHAAVIPAQNKGLCTYCDINVWVYNENGLQIKWCKGCKNFQTWASFGEKGSATKCLRCRERQREKYAASKQERTTANKRKSM